VSLDNDLDLAASRGYVVSRDEHRQGITNVGVPVRGWSSAAIGCLIATARSQEMNDHRVAIVGEEVKRSAQLLVYQAPSLESAGRFCGR
jgi:DNA-binding IclR family transcriptional regulator